MTDNAADDSVTVLVDVLGHDVEAEVARPNVDDDDGGDATGVREPRNSPPSAGTVAVELEPD